MTSDSRKSVLVLGASGFIGSRVIAALAASSAYRLIGASRHSDDLRLDATDLIAMGRALIQCDYVINCIAGRSMLRATTTLCDAARITAPYRIVHVSSMAVYGAATGFVQEHREPVAPISAYGREKLACEQLIQKYISDGGDAVILRPTCVFGPGSVQWTSRLAILLRARRIGDLGRLGDGICNLAFIDDVVAGIVRSLDADVAGRTFNLSSSSEWTWNQFLIQFGIALGAIPVKRIAPRALRLETKSAGLRRVAAKVIRSPMMTEAITPSLLALWSQAIQIDNSAALTDLGIVPTPAPHMIAAAVAWCP